LPASLHAGLFGGKDKFRLFSAELYDGAGGVMRAAGGIHGKQLIRLKGYTANCQKGYTGKSPDLVHLAD
jgi:hypothetical protein